MSILRLDNVSKQYRDKLAVDHITFSVSPGSIFGMLGPNGAGKTSTIRIITRITAPDSGVIYFEGEPLAPHHPGRMGYLPEERGLYRKMKVGEHLIYLARLKGLSAAEATERSKEMLRRFDAIEWWNKKIEELSKGMQQKIQFIATILHRPSLMILDEPFTGLDPINTHMIQDEIYRLRDEGVTIIFSTHRMEQVEEMCEDIILINQGKNILQGNVREIKNTYKQYLYDIQISGVWPQSFPPGIEIVRKDEYEATFRIPHGESPNPLLNHLINAGCEIHLFREILPSLNDIFIEKIKQSNDER